MKAVLQYRASSGFRAQIEQASPDWLKTIVVDERDTALFLEEIKNAEVLLHVLEPVTRAVVEAAPRLRLIQKIGVGVDTIDLEAARDRNIAVANMPGTNSQAVAEMTVLLMLAALRQLPVLDEATRTGQGWRFEPDRFDMFGELHGRSVGLVGFGRIGALIAPILSAFGAGVSVTRRQNIETDGVAVMSLDDLISSSDIVSLHCPLTEETKHMIDAAAFASMKPGSILINTARGGLVDQDALVAALRSGQLRAAGLDVFAAEPVTGGGDLFDMKNVVMAPHIGWLTPETLERSLDLAFENCRRVRDGTDPLNKVV